MKVILESNLFPAFTAYDSNAKPTALSKFVKFGFKVQDNSGYTLYQSESQPTVDKRITWGIFIIGIGGLAFLLYKNIK